MAGRHSNGKQLDMTRIDETVELGTTEVWEVRNIDGEYHNFHVHDVQFQVLSVDGADPDPQLSGWKGTPAARWVGPGGAAVHRLRGPGHAVHVSLPPAAARGAGMMGGVREPPPIARRTPIGSTAPEGSGASCSSIGGMLGTSGDAARSPPRRQHQDGVTQPTRRRRG